MGGNFEQAPVMQGYSHRHLAARDAGRQAPANSWGLQPVEVCDELLLAEPLLFARCTRSVRERLQVELPFVVTEKLDGLPSDPFRLLLRPPLHEPGEDRCCSDEPRPEIGD